MIAAPAQRAAVVAEARSWLGTPYHHQGALAGAGCDCLGLVRGVWRDLYGNEPETPPPYTPDWGETGQVEGAIAHARGLVFFHECQRRLPAFRDADEQVDLPRHIRLA